MLLLHLLHGNERHRCVIVCKIVRHRLDLILDPFKISAFLRDDIALSRVFLTRRQFRILSSSHSLERFLDRDRILAGIQNALDPADRVRMSLADAGSPECIIPAAGKDRMRIETVQREHARVPSAGDETDLPAGLRGHVDCAEVLRNIRVCIERIDDIVQRGIFRGHLRKICCAPAADDKDIDIFLSVRERVNMLHRSTGRADLKSCRVSSCIDCDKLHVFIFIDGSFHASPKVAVTENTCFHNKPPFLWCRSGTRASPVKACTSIRTSDKIKEAARSV